MDMSIHAPAAARSEPMRLLVVEDETLIAQDIAWVIENLLGFAVAGMASTVGEALDIIARGPLDGAILDASLNGESCVDVALELQRKGIPFFVVSGRSSNALPPPLDAATLLAKPYREQALVEEIRKLAGEGSG